MSPTSSEQTDTSQPAAADGPALRRIGGLLGILGVIMMVASAALMYSTGADLFTAVDERTMDSYLSDVTEHTGTLYLHLAVWIAGALLISLAVTLFASTSPVSASSVAARFTTTAAAGAVIVFYPMMIGLIYGLGGRPELDEVAQALGKSATMADDVATALILGFGAFLAVYSGRRDWAPTWLVRLGGLAAIIAAVSLVPLGSVRAVSLVLILVVGQALIVSMGIVGLRGGRSH